MSDPLIEATAKYPGTFGNDITVEVDEEPAVDQLADLTRTPEEIKSRKAARNLRNLFDTPVELGISPRGNGMPK